jgi:hypothetical protein
MDLGSWFYQYYTEEVFFGHAFPAGEDFNHGWLNEY